MAYNKCIVLELVTVVLLLNFASVILRKKMNQFNIELCTDYIHLGRFALFICIVNDANNGIIQKKTQEKGKRQTKILYTTTLSCDPCGSLFLGAN